MTLVFNALLSHLHSERKFDYNRLRLLDPSVGAQPLTKHEIDIVVLNLLSRVSFQKFTLPDGSKLGEEGIRWMLQHAKVIKQARKTLPGHGKVL